MNNQEFYELLCDRGANVRSYSGRGMFGKQCIGVNLDSNDSAAFALIADCVACLDTELERESAARIFARTKEDSLGLGSIIYWPSMAWDNETMQEYD